MVRQIRPAQVYKAMTNEMNHHVFKYKVAPPPWYDIVGSIPPAETFVRTIPPHHRENSKKARKPKNLYRPQEITYPEDALRRTFYKDHPWELARPRTVLEMDGKDAQRCDWSKGVRQPGVALTGECVVQRQLWLMEVQGFSRNKAYDQSRREFYRLRQQEEVERRIAIEEARYVGAYFGKNRLEVGQMLEDKEFENWKAWAQQETAAAEARASAGVETFSTEEADEGSSDYAEADSALDATASEAPAQAS